MLAKKYRFTTRLFKRCFRNSRKARMGDLTFLVSDIRGPHLPRFSVVVSKKQIKKATARNRLRRQIYEIIRKRMVPQFQRKNIICLYNSSKIEQNSADLEKSILQLLFSRIK